MTEVNEEQLTVEDRQYLNSVLQKFNADQDSEELSKAEKAILTKIRDAEKDLVSKQEKVNKLQQEIVKLREEMVLGTGQSQGYLSALLSLRE